ncbi:MAG: cache domain-containing protein, partial [Deferribacteraceae bacterium]|nr:cache domain-containing protein [Deferribacteraceae bacterium]
MNLQKKIFLVSSAPLLIIFVMVIFLTEIMVKNSLKENAASLAGSMAETYGAKMEDFFGEYVTNLTTLAGNIAMLESNYHDNPDVNRKMVLDMHSTFLGDNGYFGGTVYFKEGAIMDGAPEQELFQYRVGGEESKTYASFERQGVQNRAWYNAVSGNKAGLAPAYTFNMNTMEINTNPSRADIENPNNRYVITFAVPITLTNGTVIGALTADFRVDRLSDMIGAVKPFGTGYAMIVGPAGLVIASSNNAMLGVDYRKIDYVEGFNPSDLVDTFLRGDHFDSYFYNKTLKRDMFASVVPAYADSNIRPFGVVIAFFVDDAYAAVGMNAMLLFSRVMLALIIAIIAASTFIVRNNIIKYLNQFVAA